ncbi:MAG: hypothetical protein WCP28_01350 [Actinomycetes bacterium]
MTLGQKKAAAWAVVAAYLVVAGLQLYALGSSGSWLLAVIAGLLMILPLIGFWYLWRELAFGWKVEEMAASFEQEGSIEAALEGDRSDWRLWYVVAAGFDDDGDRKKARAAMRRALILYR